MARATVSFGDFCVQTVHPIGSDPKAEVYRTSRAIDWVSGCFNKTRNYNKKSNERGTLRIKRLRPIGISSAGSGEIFLDDTEHHLQKASFLVR